MNEVVVSCQGVSRTYQQEAVPVRALQDVDFQVIKGDFVSLAGPSGSGKSTLLNVIGGLDRPDSGTVTVAGVCLNDLSESALSDLRLEKMGFVFQAYNLIPVLSARENVEFIMQLQGVDPQQRAQRSSAVLAELGIDEMADRRPGELSGGQQQRVAVARAIVTHPVLLLADEPSANLDSATTRELLELLRRLNETQGVTIVAATHDPMVMSYAKRQVNLRDGRIVEDSHRRLPDMARHGLLLLLFAAVAPAQAMELDTRLKWFSSAASLPSHDLQRQLDGTPAYDYTADLRLMVEHSQRGFTWLAHATATLNGGDSFALPSAPGTELEQLPNDDDQRLMNLSWEIEDGSRHRSVARFDRLAVQYQSDTWALTVGREAVSWGNGLVFQPLDLFNPFAPTTVDRDYKVGDDLILVDKLFSNGMDAQLLAVGRRDEDENFTGQAGSLALRLRGFTGGVGWELAAGRHYADEVYGIGLRIPIGGALFRTDLVATNERFDDWEFSAVANLDYSLTVLERTLYVFAEYYRNGFGVDDLPQSIVELPENLVERLQRGEVFTFQKDYLALGSTIDWHPLWTQTLTLISNLNDGSSLVQTQFSYEPGDHSRLELGLVAPLGDRGDEYGGVPVLGEDVTTGGSRQAFVRFVYFL